MAADALHALIEATLASSAAIFFVLLMRQPARRVLGAQAAYWLWLIVPVAALATLLPARSVPAQAMATLAPVSKVLPDIAIIQTAAGDDFSSLWLALWMLGALLTFAWLWRQQRGFLRGLGALRAEPDGTLRAEQARAPVVVGAWRPRLVLPSDFEQRYNADERELVLAHERAHLRRGDALANALAAIAQCLFWFNPLLHWALGRYRFDQELACDAQVLADAPQGRRIYAHAMLKTQLAIDAAWRLPAGCHWQPRHPLKERIAMLKQPVPGRTHRMIGAMIAMSLVLAGSYTAWAAQPAQPASSVVADVELLDVDIKPTQLDQSAAALEAARLAGIQIENPAVVNGTSARLAPAVLQGSQKSSYKDVINLTGIWLPVAPKKDDC